MRLIDADALVKEMQLLVRIHCRDAFDALNAIDNAPTIDPESLRERGEWRKAEYKLKVYIKCSLCGHRAGFVEQSNYCPNCGARMKGGTHER